MSIKNFFALLCILSFGTFLIFKFYPLLVEEETSEVIYNKKTDMLQKPVQPKLSIEANFESNFILLSSLITSILSFLGFCYIQLSIYAKYPKGGGAV